jgi:hypothetical protein
MKFFTQFSIFPKRIPGQIGVFSTSAPQPKSESVRHHLANIVYCALALTLFYFVSRPAFK